MTEYSCKYLNEQITFYTDNVASCCSGFTSPVFYKIKDNKIDFDEIIKNKRNFVERFKNGQPLEKCLPCYNLKEYDSSLGYNKFKKLLISHYTCCNCACVYCTRDSYIPKEDKQLKPAYELLPIIKEMYKRKLISKDNLDVEFQGGDIGCLNEFTDLVKLLAKNSKSYFHFFTNNIIYYEIIEKLFNENRAELVVSLDCGSSETFERIKRVNKFNDVVNNLKRYIKNSKYPNILIKYIFLREINDNKEEIDKFLNLIKSMDLRLVCIELDFNDCMELVPGNVTKYNVPKHYYDLIKYFIDTAEKFEIGAEVGSYTKQIMEKGSFG